jgi:hypothetical protein
MLADNYLCDGIYFTGFPAHGMQNVNIYQIMNIVSRAKFMRSSS